jgi:hypothetical protein
MVKGSQMTVRWHVDDLTMSHLSNNAFLEFLREIKNITEKF